MISNRRQRSPVRQALGLFLMAVVLAASAAPSYLDAAEPHHADRIGSPASDGPHHVHHDHQLCLQLRHSPADSEPRVPALPGSDRTSVRSDTEPERPRLRAPGRRLPPARAPPLS